MSNPADTGTSREGDPYAEIAALRQRVAELERELEAARKVCDAVRALHPGAIYIGRECHFGTWSGYALGHGAREDIETFNAALAAYRATQTKEPTNEK